MKKYIDSKGQSLIEILIAIALAAVILPGLFAGFAATREGKAQEGERLTAIGIHKEMEEAVRSVRENSWSDLPTGTFYPTISGNTWALSAGSETVGNFTRQLTITQMADLGIKKVDYLTSWTQPSNGSITTTEYLTRHLGNTTKKHTTTSDFSTGTFTNTQALAVGDGAVALTPTVSGGTLIDDYTIAGNYTYDSAKIEVTGGVAQLKNIGGPVSGQTTNSAFTTNATGWTFALYGLNIVQAGSYQATGGNPGGYIRINLPKSNNKQSGGYYYQGFTTTAANPTSTLSFNWTVTAYQATPTSFHLYAWIDNTATGTPVTQVWDSGNITATSGWSGTVNVNTSSFITTPGTYYLKVGAFVNTASGNRGPYTLGFDNVLLNWSGTTNSYDATSPTIVPTTSFQPAGVTAWTSFNATEVPNGGSVGYQLSSDDGATWKYWNGSAWATATLATNYNSKSVVNTNIGSFTVASGKIRVKAFLIGNGSQQVKLDQIVIGYNGTSGNNSGTYTSPTVDAGALVAFNRIDWTEVNTANTTTSLKIAVNSDNSTWNYVGPDGTAGTSFTGGSYEIPQSLISGRYLRYQISFNSTNTDQPYVTDVTVNYSP
jgi:type II secretory pathway pseudopilin PulG